MELPLKLASLSSETSVSHYLLLFVYNIMVAIHDDDDDDAIM